MATHVTPEDFEHEELEVDVEAHAALKDFEDVVHGTDWSLNDHDDGEHAGNYDVDISRPVCFLLALRCIVSGFIGIWTLIAFCIISRYSLTIQRNSLYHFRSTRVCLSNSLSSFQSLCVFLAQPWIQDFRVILMR